MIKSILSQGHKRSNNSTLALKPISVCVFFFFFCVVHIHMDRAKQTHVFDINLKHRTEPPLLPSLLSRFGPTETESSSSYITLWQPAKPHVFPCFCFSLAFLSFNILVLSRMLCYVMYQKNKLRVYFLCTVCIYNLHTYIYIIYMDFKHDSELQFTLIQSPF